MKVVLAFRNMLVQFCVPILTTMKRLSTLPALLVSVCVAAQPVLEYANVQLMGTSYAVHLVTDPGSSDPDLDGANVTWDFSSAALELNAGTASFVAPSTTPYAGDYPSSNLAQAVVLPGGTNYNYFNLTSTQLDMLGEGIGGSDPTVYTDPKTPLQFPFSYPNWFIDYYAYDGTDYSVSRAYMGYGTVILPIGTFTNVVKMASTSGSIDFFTSNPVTHLVGIDEDGVALVFGPAEVGVDETIARPVLTAFPNPSASHVRISGIELPGTWQLLDMQGRSVRSGRHGAGSLNLDLTQEASGAYTLLIQDAQGRRSVRLARM